MGDMVDEKVEEERQSSHPPPLDAILVSSLHPVQQFQHGERVDAASDALDEMADHNYLLLSPPASLSPVLCVNTQLCPHRCSQSVIRKADLAHHLRHCPNLPVRCHEEKCDDLHPRHELLQQVGDNIDSVYLTMVEELQHRRKVEKELQVKLDSATDDSKRLREGLEWEMKQHADVVRKVRELDEARVRQEEVKARLQREVSQGQAETKRLEAKCNKVEVALKEQSALHTKLGEKSAQDEQRLAEMGGQLRQKEEELKEKSAQVDNLSRSSTAATVQRRQAINKLDKLRTRAQQARAQLIKINKQGKTLEQSLSRMVSGDTDSDTEFVDRVLSVDEWVDCFHTTNKWECARVVEVKESELRVLVWYSGWSEQWSAQHNTSDNTTSTLPSYSLSLISMLRRCVCGCWCRNEWLDMSSPRIQELGTKTTKKQVEERGQRSPPHKQSQQRPTVRKRKHPSSKETR
jgi:myosin heavy subunit